MSITVQKIKDERDITCSDVSCNNIKSIKPAVSCPNCVKNDRTKLESRYSQRTVNDNTILRTINDNTFCFFHNDFASAIK